jgi:hypothetical protein
MKWLEAKRLTQIKRAAAAAKEKKALRRAGENKMLFPDYEDKAREFAEEEVVEEEAPAEPEEVEEEEWTLATPPDLYLERYPEGPRAELAQRILDAALRDGETD